MVAALLPAPNGRAKKNAMAEAGRQREPFDDGKIFLPCMRNALSSLFWAADL
jgi:hypothetical protein